MPGGALLLIPAGVLLISGGALLLIPAGALLPCQLVHF